MINGISGATTEVLVLALDAASMRQQAIANNIANASTPGYMPLRVNFEEQLGALSRAVDRPDGEVRQALNGVRPFIEQDVAAAGAGGANVMLDMEVVKLSQTVVHYQTLLRGVSKQLSLISTAINDGRR